MLAKSRNLDRMYHDDEALKRIETPKDVYADRGNLAFFRGTHPAVMQDTVSRQDWPFDPGIERRQRPEWIRHASVWAEYYWIRAAAKAREVAFRLKARGVR